MKLKRLLSVLDVCECTADPELDVRDISFDSRTTQPGDLFAAVCGYESDGHRFIGAAVARGAAVVLCQERPEADVPYIRVADSRLALSRICCEFFGNPSRELTMIGVTGTNGKTTVTTLIKHMLEQCLHTKVGLIGTNANIIGDEVLHTEHTTPDTYELQKLLRLPEQHGKLCKRSCPAGRRKHWKRFKPLEFFFEHLNRCFHTGFRHSICQSQNIPVHTGGHEQGAVRQKVAQHIAHDIPFQRVESAFEAEIQQQDHALFAAQFVHKLPCAGRCLRLSQQQIPEQLLPCIGLQQPGFGLQLFGACILFAGFFQFRKRLVQHRDHFGFIAGLEDVMPHPQLHGLTGKFVVTIAGKHHKGHIRVLLLCLPDHLNAVHHRHLDVHDGEVRPEFCDFFQPLGTVPSGGNDLYLIGIPRYELCHSFTLDLLIVHDQQCIQVALSFTIFSCL